MPRYFFNLFNDQTAIDEEGTEWADDPSALKAGAQYARGMAAESVLNGHLILDHRIEVQNSRRRKIGTIYFRDVVSVRQHG